MGILGDLLNPIVGSNGLLDNAVDDLLGKGGAIETAVDDLLGKDGLVDNLVSRNGLLDNTTSTLLGSGGTLDTTVDALAGTGGLLNITLDGLVGNNGLVTGLVDELAKEDGIVDSLTGALLPPVGFVLGAVEPILPLHDLGELLDNIEQPLQQLICELTPVVGDINDFLLLPEVENLLDNLGVQPLLNNLASEVFTLPVVETLLSTGLHALGGIPVVDGVVGQLICLITEEVSILGPIVESGYLALDPDMKMESLLAILNVEELLEGRGLLDIENTLDLGGILNDVTELLAEAPALVSNDQGLISLSVLQGMDGSQGGPVGALVGNLVDALI